MTREEFKSILDSAIIEAESILKLNTPLDTGNMRNSWRVEDKGDRILIYLDTGQAPYAIYTNESWNEGTNPNEDWIPEGFELVMNILQKRLGGVLENTVEDGEL
jgi:hypothetical protein